MRQNQRRNRVRTRYSRRSSKLGVIGIVTVVVVMAGILFTQISDKKDELSDLMNREEQLQTQYADELNRAEILEEKRIEVKTKKYIEEVARRLGLVYPNEIQYKPKPKE